MKTIQEIQSVLELRDVSFRRSGKTIIDNISLSVARGEHWAILGMNGAGKSTLMGLCGATTHPTSGTVHVLGQRIGRVELQALRRSIGHVDPRHPVPASLSVRNVVYTGLVGSHELPARWAPSPSHIAVADDLLDRFGLGDKSTFPWQSLSQGERSRSLIARALITSPELLLLDEPSTGLDVSGRELLLETLELLAGTYPQLASVLVTHHLEELPATTTHALVIADGKRVASGPVSEVVTSVTISKAFRYPIEVEFGHGGWRARSRRRVLV